MCMGPHKVIRSTIVEASLLVWGQAGQHTSIAILILSHSNVCYDHILLIAGGRISLNYTILGLTWIWVYITWCYTASNCPIHRRCRLLCCCGRGMNGMQYRLDEISEASPHIVVYILPLWVTAVEGINMVIASIIILTSSLRPTVSYNLSSGQLITWILQWTLPALRTWVFALFVSLSVVSVNELINLSICRPSQLLISTGMYRRVAQWVNFEDTQRASIWWLSTGPFHEASSSASASASFPMFLWFDVPLAFSICCHEGWDRIGSPSYIPILSSSCKLELHEVSLLPFIIPPPLTTLSRGLHIGKFYVSNLANAHDAIHKSRRLRLPNLSKFHCFLPTNMDYVLDAIEDPTHILKFTVYWSNVCPLPHSAILSSLLCLHLFLSPRTLEVWGERWDVPMEILPTDPLSQVQYLSLTSLSLHCWHLSHSYQEYLRDVDFPNMHAFYLYKTSMHALAVFQFISHHSKLENVTVTFVGWPQILLSDIVCLILGLVN